MTAKSTFGTSATALVFFVGGLVSAVLVWAGGMRLPEESLLLKIYPGVIFGAVLYMLGRWRGLAKNASQIHTMAIIMLASIVGWRMALDVGYAYGAPVPMLAAGALGGAVTTLGLIWAWRLRQHLVRGVVIVALTGGICGQAVALLWDAIPTMSESLEVLLLFVLWQAPVMLSIALAGSVGAELRRTEAA